MNKLKLSAVTIASIPGIPPLRALPQVVKKPPVPLPIPLFYLTCGSIFVSFIFLPVSLLDLGYASCWVNPPMVFISIMFNGGTLMLAQRKRVPNRTSYYSTVILLAFVIAMGWFVSFVATVVASAKPAESRFSLTRLHEAGLPVTKSSQNFQIVAAIAQFCLIGAFALKGLMIARAEGDPRSWRPWGDDGETMSIHRRNGSVGSEDTRIGSLDLEGSKFPSKLEVEEAPGIEVVSPNSQRDSFR